jgi:hypothetical protein
MSDTTENQPHGGDIVATEPQQLTFAEAVARHVRNHNEQAQDAPGYAGPSIDVHFQNFVEEPTRLGDPKTSEDTAPQVAGPLPIPSLDDLGDLIFWLSKQFEHAAGHPCRIAHTVTSGGGTTRVNLRSL